MDLSFITLEYQGGQYGKDNKWCSSAEQVSAQLKTATHLTQILDRTGKKSALWTQWISLLLKILQL